MRFVIHPNSLCDYISQNVDTINVRSARVAKKAVSDPLLKAYEESLGELFMPWFTKEETSNRLSFLNSKPHRITPDLNDPLTIECIALTHRWGKIIAADNELLKKNNIKQILKNFDLIGISLNENTPELDVYQFSPMIEFRVKGGDKLKFAQLHRYLNNAKNIAVFDKYFTTSSIPVSFLIELLAPCVEDFQLCIFSKGCNREGMESIKNKIKKRYPNSSITVLNYFNSGPVLHDRHIYIDNCFQIDFSAGLDSLKPINRTFFEISSENKISVYSTCESSNVTRIDGRGANGASQHRTYKSA